MSARCGVVGDPIDHSLSPVLHRAGYAALDLDWTYDAWRVAEGSLADFVAADEDWRGLSVTAPLKREALLLSATSTDRARLAGRIDSGVTSFASANDLAEAFRRAEAAHGKYEARIGQGRDANWPEWYAAYMVAEQAGTQLPS